MPRRLYSCTPTRLTTWLDCPRRYRMNYLDRPIRQKGAPWAHNSLGASVHNALAGWWRLPLPRRTSEAAGALLVRRAGSGRASLTTPSRKSTATGRGRMVEAYVAILDPADEPAGVERTVATRTELIAVSGRVDRLEGTPASAAMVAVELVVVDYKTGRHLLTTDDARWSLALALYALAASRSLRRDCTRVELHHLPSGQVISWEHTEESLARHLGRAEDLAAECADADDQRRGPGCRGPPAGRGLPAPVRSLVRIVRLPAPLDEPGQRAAVPRRPWDSLAEL